MAEQPPPFFRFQNNPQIIVDGVETYGVWDPPGFISDPNSLSPDRIGTLLVDASIEGRPDNISQALYATPYLDWVLIAFNSPPEVLGWPKAGTIIKYPIPGVIFQTLG